MGAQAPAPRPRVGGPGGHLGALPRRRLEPAAGLHRYAARPQHACSPCGARRLRPFCGVAVLPSAGLRPGGGAVSFPCCSRSGPGPSAGCAGEHRAPPVEGAAPSPRLARRPMPSPLPWLRPALCREGRPCLGAGRRREGAIRRPRRGPPSAARAGGRAAGARPRGEFSWWCVLARAAAPPLLLPRRGAAGQKAGRGARERPGARPLVGCSRAGRVAALLSSWGSCSPGSAPPGPKALDKKAGPGVYSTVDAAPSDTCCSIRPVGRFDRRMPEARRGCSPAGSFFVE